MPVRDKDDSSDYRIFETKNFQDELDEITRSIRKKIYSKLCNYVYPQLRKNPYYGNNIKKLVNYNPPTWRYRIADYRMFYEVDKKNKIIYLTAIDLRNKAY